MCMFTGRTIIDQCDHYEKSGWLCVCLQVELLWITVITMKSGVGYVYVYM